MRTFIYIFLLSAFSLSSFAQVQTGKASYYADKFEGYPTASGEKYRHNRLTAAHKTLPFGTKLKVTNLANKKSVEVTVNDRGPFVEGRVIDLSKRAAEELGFTIQGLTDVSIEVVDPGDGKSSGYPKTFDPVTVEEKEFYEVKTERINPSGYGVQIGTFQELVNLMRLSENLKASYKKDVTIRVKVLNGVKVYSIIVGDFNKRTKAESFLGNVKKRYPESFIVDYSKI
ncbi:MAG: septal ring lytic transglycosylase RlpA family protein [Candidatus Cyclobacteriaceae bacterium M2_1C_046]